VTVRKVVSRSLMVLTGAAAAGMLVFGPRPPASTAAPGRVHVTYWDKWTGREGAQAQEIVDGFNATVGAQKGIYVELTSMSQIAQKTLVSAAAGVPPDIAGMWDPQVNQFAAQGALEPLGDEANAAGLTPDKYKPVYYRGCTYHGTLWALPSTVWSAALVYNKAIFQAKGAELRAAGLDPDSGPTSIAELDRYAAALDTWAPGPDGRRRLVAAGYVPLEKPSEATSFSNLTPYWFFANFVDPTGTKLQLTSPPVVAAYDWIRGYSERIGRAQLDDFRSGFGSFDSAENPFMSGQIAMEAQGTWISAFIENMKPSMNRWHVPPDELEREKAFDRVAIGQPRGEVERLLGGAGTPVAGDPATVEWPAGIKTVSVTFGPDGTVSAARADLLPAKDRQRFCQWGVVPFPSVDPARDDVTYAGMDVLTIPRGCKHKAEAFEFIKYVQRQDVMERFCTMHGVISPLRTVSASYLRLHPNPYIEAFERLAAGPDARSLSAIPNWPQISDELTVVGQRIYLLDGSTRQILSAAQRRCQRLLNGALGLPPETNVAPGGN
jgi:ABC-type glycerol-3-phosphate transport system substrate-binding protein